jgi:hypothetical protein
MASISWHDLSEVCTGAFPSEAQGEQGMPVRAAFAVSCAKMRHLKVEDAGGAVGPSLGLR